MTVKIITVGEDILGTNEEKARANNKRLDGYGILTVDIMSSPGAGKTSLIMSTIKYMKEKARMAVIEGDVASSVDADKINEMSIPVVQINTAGGCHLDANMVESALNDLPLEDTDLLLIENVGNLICPNAFILGEDKRVMISSMPEGDDKPYKYPAMFADSDLEFNVDGFKKIVTGLNPDVIFFPVSCKTGAGMDAWFAWLESAVKGKKNR